MGSRIEQALTRLFERHRLVFWYDGKRELRKEYEDLDLPGIAKVEIVNNEFGLKHRMVRGEPTQKFLIYKDGEPPSAAEDWLLDLQLAHADFRTDQSAIILSELELGLEFAEIVAGHPEFFKAVRRKESLKSLLKNDDTLRAIRLKMLAVCSSADPRIDAILEGLLEELSEGRDEKFKLIGRTGLDGFLWEQVSRFSGYDSPEPTLKDFVLEVFKSAYAAATDGEPKLIGDAHVLLKRWKDSRRYERSFEALSNECAAVLGIEKDLGGRDFQVLIEIDYFRLIDQKIISDLVKAVVGKTVTSGDVSLWVRQRRQGHWYGEFSDLYEAIDYAAKFSQVLEHSTLTMDSQEVGIERYTKQWYRVDQLYRKFIYHFAKSGQASLLNQLAEQIDNLYTNNFLLTLNDRWQSVVDGMDRWDSGGVPSAASFFRRYVAPFTSKDNKVAVIISDALRYEIADELLGLIRQEDRYTGSLEGMVSVLPSYTQLGKAALLPHQVLEISPDSSGTVMVNGKSSQGSANRRTILEAANLKAAVLSDIELMNLNQEESRALVREHVILYIYHDQIDATGHDRKTEGRVFDAVEESLHQLIRLIKKLTGANINNLLITADHGFIYQNRTIDESDFSGDSVEGDEILYRDRRFVIGRGLKDANGLKKFSASQLGLGGELEIQIPKSINRLRLKGSCIRFVHGGASLQEIVVPVLKVNKKRESDLSQVDVEILRGTSSTITSGQLAVVLYQSQLVEEKVQPRILRAGIYTPSGELISDSHEVKFDLTAANPRERELHVRLLLTRAADAANGQTVTLKLEERHAGTSHYKEYKSARYLLRRSFTSDFDF